MEEDASSSMISNANINFAAETLDSCDSNYTVRACKRLKHDGNNIIASVAKFKGVVPQHNGHWGAQIYANHQRIWLGTFKSEKEAAMAYDSAAIKLRNGDSHRNFPWTNYNIQEPNFQTQYSTEAILNMIRDGSYQLKLADFLRTQSQREEMGASLNQRRVHGDEPFSCIQLFQKELTPSDVGKLNRLVIPKKFAIKYFPSICENNVELEDSAVPGAAGIDNIELVFYDRLMKSWKFRYCYWRSSQSFVFTRGWNRFVKEKKLKEKDIIIFYACECQQGQNFSLIDITYGNGQSCMAGDGVSQTEEMQKELELNLGQSVIKPKLQTDEKELKGNLKTLSGLESKTNVKEKGLRIFGVQIN